MKKQNVIWTDEAFKEYFGMSKQEIEQIVEQEHEDIRLELRKIEGIDGLFDNEGKLLLN
jgi:hypothetical protein